MHLFANPFDGLFQSSFVEEIKIVAAGGGGEEGGDIGLVHVGQFPDGIDDTAGSRSGGTGVSSGPGQPKQAGCLIRSASGFSSSAVLGLTVKGCRNGE